MTFQYPKDKTLRELFKTLHHDEKYSKNYIKYVEERFIKAPMWAVQYAIYFLKRRWIEAEYNIMTKGSKRYKQQYLEHFIGKSWPDGLDTYNFLYKYWHEMMLNKICSDIENREILHTINNIYTDQKGIMYIDIFLEPERTIDKIEMKFNLQ